MFNLFYKKNAWLLILLLCSLTSYSQGLHFSYIEFAPQSVNPGLIGGFSGSYRGALLYRSQWQNTGVKGYSTLEIGIDAPIIQGFRKQDWVGAGISLDIDDRGQYTLRDRYSRIGLSYHFSLDKKQTSILTLGLQMVGMNRSLNVSKFQECKDCTAFGIETGLSDQILTELIRRANSNNQGGNANPRLTGSASDFGGGLVYTRKSKNMGFKIGLSATSLFKPEISLATQGSLSYLPFKMMGFASVYNQINKKTSIEPIAFFQRTAFGSELMLNAKVGYQFKPNTSDKLKVGLGYRTGTSSAILFAGANIKGIDFGMSFDLPFTGYANADGFQNSVEIGASYVGFLKKTPKPTPIILCPRL